MPHKAHTTFIQTLRLNYAEMDTTLALTSGLGGLTLSIRMSTDFAGKSTNLTPEEARALAAELVERADEIDEHAAGSEVTS